MYAATCGTPPAWCAAMHAIPRLLAAVGLAASGFFTTPAHADPLETVFLKNGGLVRGLLVEILPGDHVTVQLPSGEFAKVAWPDVDHVERASAPPKEAPAPALTAPAVGARALVHIESPRHVTLDRKNPGENEPWVIACESPCDVELPLDNEYRIVGSGVRPSSDFRLEASPGQRVVLEVNPSSKAVRAAGIVVGSLGITAIVTGLYLWAWTLPAMSACSASTDVTSGCDMVRSIGRAGLITAGAGALVGILGGVLFFSSNRSKTTESHASPGAASAAPLAVTF
jgi:hypothetical protein